MTVRLPEHLATRKKGTEWLGFVNDSSTRDNSTVSIPPLWWTRGARPEDNPNAPTAENSRIALAEAQAIGQPHEYRGRACEVALATGDRCLSGHRKVLRYKKETLYFRTSEILLGPRAYESTEQYRNDLRDKLRTRIAGVDSESKFLHRYDRHNQLLLESDYPPFLLKDRAAIVVSINEKKAARTELPYTLHLPTREAEPVQETNSAPSRYKRFHIDQQFEASDGDALEPDSEHDPATGPEDEDEDQDIDRDEIAEPASTPASASHFRRSPPATAEDVIPWDGQLIAQADTTRKASPPVPQPRRSPPPPSVEDADEELIILADTTTTPPLQTAEDEARREKSTRLDKPATAALDESTREEPISADRYAATAAQRDDSSICRCHCH